MVTIDPGEPVKEHTIIIKRHIKKRSRDPAFKCEGTSIPLVEEVELLGVTFDDKFEVPKSNQENMSQSEPANRFFEKDEEVPSFKAAGKAIQGIYCSTF